MDRKIVKAKINIEHLANGLGLDPLIIDMTIDAIFSLWDKIGEFEGFPCISGCRDCCSNAAITCTTIEWAILKAAIPETPNSGFGCPYKTKQGCGAYEYRPLVCRLFGYMVPYKFPVVRVREQLAGEVFDWLVITPGYCLKKKLETPIEPEKMAEIMTTYKGIVDKTSIVIAGLFKEKDLNKGLATIDKFWIAKRNLAIWHRE